MSRSEKKPGSRRTSSRGQVALVVDTLGKQIVSSRVQPEHTFPVEQELADSLQVGRNALREAIKILSAKGLISTAPRSGTKVRPVEDWNMLDPDVLAWHADPDIATPQFMLDLTEVRRVIEPEASRIAAQRATRADVAEILSAYEAMENARDQEQMLEADIRFHTAILRATQNVVLANFRHCIVTFLGAHAKYVVKDSEIDRENLRMHRDIAWAIAAGNDEDAHARTAELLRVNRKKIENHLTASEPNSTR